jgi:hypothetical protein
VRAEIAHLNEDDDLHHLSPMSPLDLADFTSSFASPDGASLLQQVNSVSTITPQAEACLPCSPQRRLQPQSLLKFSAFQPEEITCMTPAYEDALRMLQLADRQDPIRELVAKKIIEAAQLGDLAREQDHRASGGTRYC